MDSPNGIGAEGADVIALPLTRDAARGVVLREHDALVDMVMLTIDLLDDAQTGACPPLNMPNMRKAAGRRLRKSVAARDAALVALMAEVG